MLIPQWLFDADKASPLFAPNGPLNGESPRLQHYRFIHCVTGHCIPVPPNQLTADRIPDIPGYINDLQRQGYNVYWGPNGGPKDKDVASCRFHFVEWDPPEHLTARILSDAEFREKWKIMSYERILDVELPRVIGDGCDQWRHSLTAVMWSGGKSWHVYLKPSSPRTPEEWKQRQITMSKDLGSDHTIINPSRVMRFPGSTYLHFDQESNSIKILGQAEILAIAPFV